MENQKRLINRGILFFELLFFATVFLFWGIFYSNHLIQKEQMQLFLMDWAFLKSHLAFQGGITKWLAGFLIQFFFNPWLGAFIYALAIFLLYTVVKKILRDFEETHSRLKYVTIAAHLINNSIPIISLYSLWQM